jgi:hypothetical protein
MALIPMGASNAQLSVVRNLYRRTQLSLESLPGCGFTNPQEIVDLLPRVAKVAKGQNRAALVGQ